MFWFDKNDSRAIFCDKRKETLIADSRQGRREITISPDIMADFTELPFEDNTFSLVVFDPPHLKRNGKQSWMAKKYGILEKDWKGATRDGVEPNPAPR
jgi:23S rRNA G2069 N7-methylase RlmK/C1962 C5-methylase RlmI